MVAKYMPTLGIRDSFPVSKYSLDILLQHSYPRHRNNTGFRCVALNREAGENPAQPRYCKQRRNPHRATELVEAREGEGE